jgi:hypothetical protein
MAHSTHPILQRQQTVSCDVEAVNVEYELNYEMAVNKNTEFNRSV